VKKILPIILLLGVIMFTSLFSAFGMGGKQDMPTMHTRQINLSGNVFSFNMPEDFSRDMPAEAVIEQLGLESSPALSSAGYITLMRRWWDIKEPGFFGKDMGTIMMSLNVRHKPENQAGILKVDTYDFHELLHFIVALYDSLQQRYSEHNKEVAASGDDDFSVYIPGLATQVGENIYPNYEVIVRNNTHWIFTGTAQERQLEKIYALPLTNDLYLEVAFELMPNDNIVARKFVDLAMVRVNAIIDTFSMHYTSDNEFAKITTTGWMNKTLLDELKEKNIQLFNGAEASSLENF